MKEKDKSKRMFEYSLGIVFIGFATFWGTSSYFSSIYLSSDQKHSLLLLFFLLLAGSLFLLLNVVANGLSLVSYFEGYGKGLKNFSGDIFELGIFLVFMGFLVYLPFFISSLLHFVLPFKVYFFLMIIIIFLVFNMRFGIIKLIIPVSKVSISCHFFLMIIITFVVLSIRFGIIKIIIPVFKGSVSCQNIKKTLSYQNLRKRKYGFLFIIFMITTLFVSFFGTCFAYSNSFAIVMEEKYSEKGNLKFFLITVKVTGFASIDSPEGAYMYISSGDTWVELPLYRLEDDFYYTYVNRYEFGEGTHFVRFISPNRFGADFVEYLVISSTPP